MCHIGRFISLATMGYRSQIWSVCLKDNPVERDMPESFGQTTVLECYHTANAKDKAFMSKHPGSRFLTASEAVEHSTQSLGTVTLHDIQQFLLCLPHVYDKRQITFRGPRYLAFESLNLFLTVCCIPIEVQSYLAHGNHAVQLCLHAVKHLRPILSDILRMKAHHRIAHTRILFRYLHHTANALLVDIGHEHLIHPCLQCPSQDLGPVIIKLGAVYMTMSIYHQLFRPNKPRAYCHRTSLLSAGKATLSRSRRASSKYLFIKSSHIWRTPISLYSEVTAAIFSSGSYSLASIHCTNLSRCASSAPSKALMSI